MVKKRKKMVIGIYKSCRVTTLRYDMLVRRTSTHKVRKHDLMKFKPDFCCYCQETKIKSTKCQHLK